MIPPIDIALTINGREVSLDSIPNSVYELLCKFEQRIGVYRIMTYDGITRKIWWERMELVRIQGKLFSFVFSGRFLF